MKVVVRSEKGARNEYFLQFNGIYMYVVFSKNETNSCTLVARESSMMLSVAALINIFVFVKKIFLIDLIENTFRKPVHC